MTALKLELSTLSTSYTSLQSTLILLQVQLVDLKRVNNQLQEDNESYMILLREKTLSGQFDLLKHVGGAPNTTDGGYDDDEVMVDDAGSLRSTGRSMLDRVEEEMTEDNDLERCSRPDSRSSNHHGHHDNSTRGYNYEITHDGKGFYLSAQGQGASEMQSSSKKAITAPQWYTGRMSSKPGSHLKD
ncbi:hypothetical protein BDR06DRAFT_1000767 [Suillus hirtellus]|nr:hypothetical protein BDR06DRAFT_1000767 [Suillus hirtellus]